MLIESVSAYFVSTTILVLNLVVQVNIKSLEDVIRKYLSLAEEKTEAARKESHQSVIDVDDLDVLLTPEKYIIGAKLMTNRENVKNFFGELR